MQLHIPLFYPTFSAQILILQVPSVEPSNTSCVVLAPAKPVTCFCLAHFMNAWRDRPQGEVPWLDRLVCWLKARNIQPEQKVLKDRISQCLGWHLYFNSDTYWLSLHQPMYRSGIEVCSVQWNDGACARVRVYSGVYFAARKKHVFSKNWRLQCALWAEQTYLSVTDMCLLWIFVINSA